MRIIIIAALGLTLASCSQGPDASVCTPIMEPTPPSDPVAGVAQRDTLEWSIGKAERCLHRNAYRLHTSTDEADTVARAVVQACGSAVERAVSYRRAQAFVGEPQGTPVAERVKVGDAAEAAARRSWSELAVMKVVEGRAGRCKP